MISITDYENLLERLLKITFNDKEGNSRKVFCIQETIRNFQEDRKNDPFPSIKELVLSSLNISVEMMTTRSRKGQIPIIRQLIAWFYWNYSELSSNKIADIISEETVNYDHVTVLHSIKKINQLLSVDKETCLQVSIITENIKKYYTKVIRQSKKQTK